MTTTIEKHEAPEQQAPGRTGWLMMPALWGAIAIASMWVAVLFDSIYGGDLVSADVSGTTTTIPSAVFVGFFAFLATASVAKRAFGRRDAS